MRTTTLAESDTEHSISTSITELRTQVAATYGQDNIQSQDGTPRESLLLSFQKSPSEAPSAFIQNLDNEINLAKQRS
jgi:hypothetical protein